MTRPSPVARQCGLTSPRLVHHEFARAAFPSQPREVPSSCGLVGQPTILNQQNYCCCFSKLSFRFFFLASPLHPLRCHHIVQTCEYSPRELRARSSATRDEVTDFQEDIDTLAVPKPNSHPRPVSPSVLAPLEAPTGSFVST